MTSARPAVDPDLKALLDAVPLAFSVDDGVEVAREKFRALKPPPNMLVQLRIEERVIGSGELQDIPARIYWPPVEQHDNLPVIVYYHGGGWAIGDLDTHDHVARAHSVGAEAIVVSVDYRLAPEHPFPAAVDDAVAAVLDGRRLYTTREELLAVVATADPARTGALAEVIERDSGGGRERPDSQARGDIEHVLECVERNDQGAVLGDGELARLAWALTDTRVRDTLYALAVGDKAGSAESLWVQLSQTLPEPWRVEALVLLAFSAYARGDGPLAGISLDAALRCGPHRMAGMLDRALQCGMRPEQIRELALSGYRIAGQLGVRLPPRLTYGRRAG